MKGLIYSEPADRWRLVRDRKGTSLVLTQLSIGRTPYAGGNANKTIKKIKAGYRLPPPDEISQFQWLVEHYKEVTQMCWHPKPKQRSSFSNLVATFETYLTSEEK